MDRRKFIKTLGIVGAAAAIPWKFDTRNFRFMTARALAFAQSPLIPKFAHPLPGLGPAGIPLLTKTTGKFLGTTTDQYSIGVNQFTQQLDPVLPKATTLWGYYDKPSTPASQRYLGGVVVAKRGTPVLFSITNQLPDQSIIPVDPTIFTDINQTVGQLPLNRIATHLHGGLTPWFSDGTPFQWFTPAGPNFMTGPSFMNVPSTNPPPGTATYYYPMAQSARFVWYHDHAIGITRTNAYAGIASALIITDDFESGPFGLIVQGLLPDLVGIPLVIQDKTFVPSNILDIDSTWAWGKPGDLWYPNLYEANAGPAMPACPLNANGRWDFGGCVSPPAAVTAALPNPSAVPEFFADTAMVNGAPYPNLENVPAKRVRFRMLNGSQARFWHLNLYVEDPDNPGEPLTTTNSPTDPPYTVVGVPGPIMYQVGTEGGFLPAVAVHDNTTPCPRDLTSPDPANTALPDGPFNLLMGPAERADLVIDFNGVAAGTSFILYSDTPAPFPGGDPRNDYYTNDPDQTSSGGAPATVLGSGPNTRTIMRIVCSGGSGDAIPTPTWLSQMNTALANNFKPGSGNPGVPPQQDALLAQLVGGQFIPVPNPSLNPDPFFKTLNEDFDNYGRLLQLGGTSDAHINSQGLTSFGKGYMEPATETPQAGEIQIWDFYNTTGDTHPWHFHLVNVQVMGRGIFATAPVTGLPIFGSFTDLNGNSGKLTPPDANELGWKETVRMNPGEITRVIMKFDLPVLPPAMDNPGRDRGSPRFAGQYPGKVVHEYVHHCHILEHEEHDMMRPLLVLTDVPGKRPF